MLVLIFYLLRQKEAERFEKLIVTTSTENGRQGIVLLPGVKAAMDELAPVRTLPAPLWAICTSATYSYASAAVSIAGVPVPDVFVVAEDVERGKPQYADIVHLPIHS